MSLLKVIVIVSVVSFISLYIYNPEPEFRLDACFVDVQAVFEPASFTNEVEFLAHGGGLNKCGCHFNRKTGECHCHRNTGCGCECQPSSCE